MEPTAIPALVDLTQGQLRLMWRRGQSAATTVALTSWVRQAWPTFAPTGQVEAALAVLAGRDLVRQLPSRTQLTPRAQVAFTLHDRVLDRTLPPRADQGPVDVPAAVAAHVAAALSERPEHALRLHPARTVEYLLRARHGAPAQAARTAGAACAAQQLARPAARFLVDGAVLPGAAAVDLLAAVTGLVLPG